MDGERTSSSTNPLRFCEQLYSVVVGLGLALAAEQVIDLSRSGTPVIWERVPMFVAFLSVAFPYAHGAVRYIDVVYVERRVGTVPRMRAIADVLLDGVRMWWLIALSLVVARPVAFGVVLILLLLSGACRSLIARITKTAARSELEKKLDQVNGAMLLATVVVLAGAHLFGGATEEVTRLGVLVAALVYPFAFYISSYRYFFGD